MQIVSDRGMDISPEQRQDTEIHLIPLTLTLDGKSYRSGVDIQPDEFYQLLEASPNFPTTSQPSAGDFADLYRSLAASDPDILSIHISSGLSGTTNSAKAATQLVPEANVKLVDTKTLSVAEGWQVEAGVRAAKAGWSMERAVDLIARVREATDTLFTISTLRYLIHGGRISHIKGLLAQVLNIKPIIGVEKEHGTYIQCGQARTLDKAILQMADLIEHRYPSGSALRVQLAHAHNLPGTLLLKEKMDKMFRCTWLPTCDIAPVLGAHTGAGLVGVCFGLTEAYADMP